MAINTARKKKKNAIKKENIKTSMKTPVNYTLII